MEPTIRYSRLPATETDFDTCFRWEMFSIRRVGSKMSSAVSPAIFELESLIREIGTDSLEWGTPESAKFALPILLRQRQRTSSWSGLIIRHCETMMKSMYPIPSMALRCGLCMVCGRTPKREGEQCTRFLKTERTSTHGTEC